MAAFGAVTEINLQTGATNPTWLNGAMIQKIAVENGNTIIFFTDNTFIAVTQTLAQLEALFT